MEGTGITHADLEPDREGGLRVLLEHELRCWDAEAETARELAAKLSVLLPASLGVLGVGFFRLGWVAELDLPWGGEWIIRVLGLGALALETRALWILLTIRFAFRRRGVPSQQLQLPRRRHEILEEGRSRAMRAVYSRTTAGVQSLSGQNRLLRARLDQAQAAFFLALVLLISGLGCYSLMTTAHGGG